MLGPRRTCLNISCFFKQDSNGITTSKENCFFLSVIRCFFIALHLVLRRCHLSCSKQQTVPPFGVWESADNITEKFNNARKDAKNSNGTAGFNPNDPESNPGAFRKAPSAAASPRVPESPLHQRVTAAASRRPASGPSQHGGVPAPERRASEMHPPRTPGRTERKSTEGTRKNQDATEDSVAVPPFGTWDDSNAASGEKFTGIFKRVRDDISAPSPLPNPQRAAASQANPPNSQANAPCCCIL